MERALTSLSKTELVEKIVDAMDIATLWRWEKAIKKRMGKESESWRERQEKFKKIERKKSLLHFYEEI